MHEDQPQLTLAEKRRYLEGRRVDARVQEAQRDAGLEQADMPGQQPAGMPDVGPGNYESDRRKHAELRRELKKN